MTERPILFSAPMVRAILTGTKTQTRRVVKPQPDFLPDHGYRVGDALCCNGKPVMCPFGHPGGDRLWVREAWGTCSVFDDVAPRDLPPFAPMKYYADGKIVGATAGYGLILKARPSIHMPRRFSRINLEITAVSVERLQGISEADAVAEGWMKRPEVSADPHVHADAARDWYSDLWEQINGPGSWDANPWVWCLTFKRV